jgi:hypothetical protein
MEDKSARNASILMIIGGLLVLGNYSLKLVNEEKHETNNLIIAGCALVFIACGVFSLIRTSNKNKV